MKHKFIFSIIVATLTLIVLMILFKDPAKEERAAMDYRAYRKDCERIENNTKHIEITLKIKE